MLFSKNHYPWFNTFQHNIIGFSVKVVLKNTFRYHFVIKVPAFNNWYQCGHLSNRASILHCHLCIVFQGTDYQRVIPTKEINISARDQFWAKAEVSSLFLLFFFKLVETRLGVYLTYKTSSSHSYAQCLNKHCILCVHEQN